MKKILFSITFLLKKSMKIKFFSMRLNYRKYLKAILSIHSVIFALFYISLRSVSFSCIIRKLRFLRFMKMRVTWVLSFCINFGTGERVREWARSACSGLHAGGGIHFLCLRIYLVFVKLATS